MVLRALKNLLAAKQVQTGEILITKDSPPDEVVRAALVVLQRAAHEAFDPDGNPYYLNGGSHSDMRKGLRAQPAFFNNLSITHT